MGLCRSIILLLSNTLNVQQSTEQPDRMPERVSSTAVPCAHDTMKHNLELNLRWDEATFSKGENATRYLRNAIVPRIPG